MQKAFEAPSAGRCWEWGRAKEYVPHRKRGSPYLAAVCYSLCPKNSRTLPELQNLLFFRESLEFPFYVTCMYILTWMCQWHASQIKHIIGRPVRQLGLRATSTWAEVELMLNTNTSHISFDQEETLVNISCWLYGLAFAPEMLGNRQIQNISGTRR